MVNIEKSALFYFIQGSSGVFRNRKVPVVLDKNFDVWAIDDNAFRRAAYHAFLTGCMEADNIVVKSCGSDVEHWQGQPAGQSLVLLILAGHHLLEDIARSALSRLQQVVGDAPIVVVLDDITGADIGFALETGLRGLICTKDEASVALAAIRFMIAGGSYIPHDRAYTSRPETSAAPSVESAGVVIAKDQSVRISDLVTTLTPRQEEVFAVLARGASNKSIARTLSLSEATVKIHVRNIFQKLSVNNRVQAALFARNSMAE